MRGSLGRKFHFKEHSPAEVVAWNERLALAYDENGDLRRYLSDDEQAFILNELTLSKYDFEYWASRYCTISSDQAHLEKLVLRASQRKLLDKWGELEESNYPFPVGKIGLVVPKARRVGATVLAQAAIAHGAMLRSQAKALVASDIPENSLQLFQIQDRIYKHLPVWMKPHIAGRVKSEQLYFDKLDSEISIGHGAQKNPLGQGMRLDFIHFTEAATWLPVGIAQIDEDVLPAFSSSKAPTTLFMIESTGKSSLEGDGLWFEDQCRLAHDNKSFFRMVFLSWYDAPEMHGLPADGIEFNETTKAVAGRIKRESGVEITREQMAFYQVTREHFESKGELSKFAAEYPTTWEEAFQYGLPCAWPIEVIDRVHNNLNEQKPILSIFDVDVKKRKLINETRPKGLTDSKCPQEWDGDPNNRVILYEEPRPGFTYVVGVDAAYGIEGKDSAAIFVNRVGSRFAKDKQVASFRGIIEPSDLAIPAWILGHIYTDRETGQPALMAIECNPGSPGLMTQTELLKMGYPNFYVWRKENSTTGGWTSTIGWHTTPSTRPLLTKKGVKAITDGEWLISSPFFVNEMRTFVNYGAKNRRGVDAIEYFAHAPGKHDDEIFAGFIAYYVSHDYDRQDVADERRKYYDTLQNRKLARPKNHQALDTAYDELMEGFEDSLDFLGGSNYDY